MTDFHELTVALADQTKIGVQLAAGFLDSVGALAGERVEPEFPVNFGAVSVTDFLDSAFVLMIDQLATGFLHLVVVLVSRFLDIWLLCC